MTIAKLSRTMFILAATALSFVVHAQSAKPEPRYPKDPKFAVVQAKPPSNKWLLDADTDAERFRRIELVTSGYDIPMIEIGVRYEELVGAVKRSNWDLAAYQIEKITARMNQTAIKRPGRTDSLERHFLESAPWAEVAKAVKAKDNLASVQHLGSVTGQCMACHVAEGLGYMNDSGVFLRLREAQ